MLLQATLHSSSNTDICCDQGSIYRPTPCSRVSNKPCGIYWMCMMQSVRGRPVFCSENILEFFQLSPRTPSAFFGLQPPLSSRDTSEYFSFQAPSSSPQHYCLHSNPSSDTPSEDYSETSTSSEGSLETSSYSVPSDPNSAPAFLGDSPSGSGDKAAPAASDIKGRVVKVICNIKG